jgi:hypothetical protein
MDEEKNETNPITPTEPEVPAAPVAEEAVSVPTMAPFEPKVEGSSPVEPPVMATIPTPTESNTAPTDVSNSTENSELPEELKGWNWGGFFFTWLWSINHKTWIGLISLISPINLIMMFVLGAKGNEWAWKNRKFESVEQFKAVQKAWTMWGIIFLAISLLLGVVFGGAIYANVETIISNTETINTTTTDGWTTFDESTDGTVDNTIIDPALDDTNSDETSTDTTTVDNGAI